MPVVQGKIDLKGSIEFEGYLHDENTDVEKEQSCTREVRGTVSNRGKTHTHTAMREGLEQPRERLRTSTPLSQPRQREMYVCCVCMDRLMANFTGTCD